MDSDVIAADLDAMVEVGAGGVESTNFIAPDQDGYDPGSQSWGTPLWSQRLAELYEGGRDRGMRVDTIYTPNWSAGTTTVSPDSEGSAQEISFAHETVNAGDAASGELPISELPEGVESRELVSVLAYECAADCGGETLPTLRQETFIDLTPQLDSEGSLDWSAPTGSADWVVIASWSHGTGQTIGRGGMPEAQYMVDHFDVSGFNAIRDYWESEVLTPELREAMQLSGGSIFFDSLEVNREGRQIRNWTADFLAEFEARRGYSLTPYLPVVGVAEQPAAAPDLPEWAAPPPLPEYNFDNEALVDRVQQDYSATVSELFIDEHIKPLKEWANSLGLSVRGQGYSSWGPTNLDVQAIYRELDIAEGESRSFGAPPFSDPPFIDVRSNDSWRAMASAVASADKNIVSTECCATGLAWEVPRQTLLSYMNQQFSAGVNQVIYHGWSHKAPALTAKWPGWEGFNGGTTDSYGPHNPQFGHDRMMNDYVARTQHVLRQGELRTDIGIYREGVGHSIEGLSGSPYWEDQSLTSAGFSYGFLNAEMVNDPSIDVRDGLLDTDGPQYRAMIYNGTENSQNYSSMSLESASQFEAWALAGLPVIVVGNPPSTVTGNKPELDADLVATFSRILTHENTVQVPDESAVPAALKSLGVQPAAQFAEAEPLQTQHRETDDANYYFLWNSSAEREAATVTLTGTGTPFMLDAWTGEAKPVSDFTRIDSDRVQVNIDLAAADATIFALDKTGEESSPQPGQTSGNRESETWSPNSWTMDVTSFQEGDSPSNTAQVDIGTFTVPTSEGALAAWNEIPGLESTSGVGEYHTTYDVAGEWSAGSEATLDLGEVLGTYTVNINGEQLPPHSQLDSSRIDISTFLTSGKNEIVVEVATLLGNAINDDGARYGLIGPVTLEAERPSNEPGENPPPGESPPPGETPPPTTGPEPEPEPGAEPGEALTDAQAQAAGSEGDDLARTGAPAGVSLAIPIALVLLGAAALAFRLTSRRRSEGTTNSE